MTLADIREQIKTILSTVPGIGIVHDYERLAVSWDDVLKFYKDADGRINGWTITRPKTDERWLTNMDYERIHKIVIRGVYGWQDAAASEIVFQTLVEAISDTFRGNDTLNGVCETICPQFGEMDGKSGIQVAIVEPRMFASVLCHYCELHLGVQIKGQK